MTIIHVHELYSNQVVEITANSISDCLWAYARHNAWDLKELEKTHKQTYRKPYIDSNLQKVTFSFATEQLTLERLNGSNVWLAIWGDMDV